jgi:hypothetical protein
VRLSSWEVAYEAAQELMDKQPGVLSLEIMEYRPAEVRDVCTHTLTDEVWDCIDSLFQDWDDLCTEDGWPVLGAAYRSWHDPRPPAWHRLRETLQDLIAQHLDLSEAAWQPTGRVRRVTHDGTSYQWEEISDAD